MCIRDRVKRIPETIDNVYRLGLRSTYKECLEVIASDSDKDREFVRLVGLSAEPTLEYVYDNFKEIYLNGALMRTE